MLIRIKETEDGKDFIQMLENISVNNYKAWKHTENNSDIFKGQAIAIDGLLDLFNKCSQKMNDEKPEQHEWL